jgi:hypothetical protein
LGIHSRIAPRTSVAVAAYPRIIEVITDGNDMIADCIENELDCCRAIHISTAKEHARTPVNPIRTEIVNGFGVDVSRIGARQIPTARKTKENMIA